MRTINNIIENSALGVMNRTFKYVIAFIFTGILAMVVSLLIFMVRNADYVSAAFNF